MKRFYVKTHKRRNLPEPQLRLDNTARELEGIPGVGSSRVSRGVGSSRRVSPGVAVGCSLAVSRIGILSYVRSKQTGQACRHWPPLSPAVGIHDSRIDFVLDGAAHPASGGCSQRTGNGIAVDAGRLDERVGRHVVHQGGVPLWVVVVAVLVHIVVLVEWVKVDGLVVADHIKSDVLVGIHPAELGFVVHVDGLLLQGLLVIPVQQVTLSVDRQES
jgi:hypothetical protein